VVAQVLHGPRLFSELLQCPWNDDAVVRMRAADAAEKISLEKPELLQPFKAEILGLADENQQQAVQWHMALMMPRLQLTGPERRRAAQRLTEYRLHRKNSRAAGPTGLGGRGSRNAN